MQEASIYSLLAALASCMLVLIGIAQVSFMAAQKRQQRLSFAESFGTRWRGCRESWEVVVFVGRDKGAYYQVANEDVADKINSRIQGYSAEKRDNYSINALQIVSNILSDVSLKILQGQVKVSDVYPMFGTEILRQSRPLKTLLDNASTYHQYGIHGPYDSEKKHINVRRSMQTWLIYHDGIRRRCLILIDLLWAEAVRLEDLPPDDIKSAADTKMITGNVNRKKLQEEVLMLRGKKGVFFAKRMAALLSHSEYRSKFRKRGVDKDRLEKLSTEWKARLLKRF